MIFPVTIVEPSAIALYNTSEQAKKKSFHEAPDYLRTYYVKMVKAGLSGFLTTDENSKFVCAQEMYRIKVASAYAVLDDLLPLARNYWLKMADFVINAYLETVAQP